MDKVSEQYYSKVVNMDPLLTKRYKIYSIKLNYLDLINKYI